MSPIVSHVQQQVDQLTKLDPFQGVLSSFKPPSPSFSVASKTVSLQAFLETKTNYHHHHHH